MAGKLPYGKVEELMAKVGGYWYRIDLANQPSECHTIILTLAVDDVFRVDYECYAPTTRVEDPDGSPVDIAYSDPTPNLTTSSDHVLW